MTGDRAKPKRYYQECSPPMFDSVILGVFNCFMSHSMRSAVVATLFGLCGCGGGVTMVDTTAPLSPSGPTHPAGLSSTRISTNAAPSFGIGINVRDRIFALERDGDQALEYQVSTGFGVGGFVGGQHGDIVFSPDGLTGYLSSLNTGRVRRTELASYFEFLSPKIAQSAYRLQISVDGARLYMTDMAGTLYVLQTPDLKIIQSVTLGDSAHYVEGLSLSPTGRYLLASSPSGRLWRLDATSLAILSSATLSGAPQDVAWSPDEAKAYVALDGGFVVALSGTSLNEMARVATPQQRPFGLAISPDGQQLYVSSPQTGDVAIIDASTLAVLRKLAVGGSPRRIAFNHSGTAAAIANEGTWFDLIK